MKQRNSLKRRVFALLTAIMMLMSCIDCTFIAVAADGDDEITAEVNEAIAEVTAETEVTEAEEPAPVIEVVKETEQPEVTVVTEEPKAAEVVNEPEVIAVAEEPVVAEEPEAAEVITATEEPEVKADKEPAAEAAEVIEVAEEPEAATEAEVTEVTEETKEPEVIEVTEEAEVIPETAEVTEEPEVIPEAAEVTEEAEVIPEAAEDTEAVTEAEEPAVKLNAKEDVSFVKGYAVVSASADVKDAEGVKIAEAHKGFVVYVTSVERSANKAAVAYSVNGEIVKAEIKADKLMPMTEDEAEAWIADNRNAVTLSGSPALPLAEMPASWVITVEETEAAEEAEVIEETEAAEEAEAIEETEATEETKVVEETEVTEEAEVIEEAEATEEPEVAEEAQVIEETEEPEVTEEPEITEEPEVIEEAEVIEETEATEEPEVVEEAEATEEPEVVEETEVVEEVVEAEVIDDIRVIVDKATGVTVAFGFEAIPEGIDPLKVKTSVKRVELDFDTLYAMYESGIDISAYDFAAYDIALIDGETGNEFEPMCEVFVSIPSADDAELVIHVDDSTNVEEITGFNNVSGEVKFDASSFSTYIVGTPSISIMDADKTSYTVPMQKYFSVNLFAEVDENDPSKFKAGTYTGEFHGEPKVNEITKDFFSLEIYQKAVEQCNANGLGPVFWGDKSTMLGYIPYSFIFPAGTAVVVDGVSFKTAWPFRDSFDRVISGVFIKGDQNLLNNVTAQSCWNYNASTRAFSMRLSESGWTIQDLMSKYNSTKDMEDRIIMSVPFTVNVTDAATFGTSLGKISAKASKMKNTGTSSNIDITSSLASFLLKSNYGISKAFPTINFAASNIDIIPGAKNPVMYTFVDEDGNEVPDEVMALLPVSEIVNVLIDDEFTLDDVEVNDFDGVKTDDGLWTFVQWQTVTDEDSVSIKSAGSTVLFKGVWKFAEFPPVEYYAVVFDEDDNCIDPNTLTEDDMKAIAAVMPENTTTAEETAEAPAEPADGTVVDGSYGTYSFDGWYIDEDATTVADGEQDVDPITGIEFYAKWVYVPNPAVITYEFREKNGKDVSNLSKQYAAELEDAYAEVNAGTVIFAPDFPEFDAMDETEDGVWVFDNWYYVGSDDALVMIEDDGFVAEGDTIVVGMWRLIPAPTRVAVVTFDTNLASKNSETASIVMVEGETDILPGADIIDFEDVSGITFLGWDEDANAIEPAFKANDKLFAPIATYAANGSLLSYVTLYAIWDKSTVLPADLLISQGDYQTESDAIVTFGSKHTSADIRMFIDMTDVAAAADKGDLSGAEKVTLSIEMCLQAYMHGSKDAELPSAVSAYSVKGIDGLSVTEVTTPATGYKTVKISGTVDTAALAAVKNINIDVNGIKYQPLLSTGVSTYHRVMTESLTIKAEIENIVGGKYSRSWSGEQMDGGRDYTQRLESNQTGIWVTWNNEADLMLFGDVQVSVNGGSYDTESDEVVIVADGDSLEYLAVLDVSPIQQQIKDVYASEVNADSRSQYMECIYLSELESTFNLSVSFDKGLKYSTSKSDYTLIGTDCFEVTSVTPNYGGVDIVFKYIGGSGATVNNGKISETFYDLYTHIVDETESVLALKITGVSVDAMDFLKDSGFDDYVSFPMTVFGTLDGTFDSKATMLAKDYAITGVPNDTVKPFSFVWGMQQNHDLKIENAPSVAALNAKEGEGLDVILVGHNTTNVQLTVTVKPTVTLPMDIQVMTPVVRDDAPDTENAAVYLTRDQETLRYYGLLDVRAIQKQIQDIADMMNIVTSGATDSQWENIELTKLRSRFIAEFTADEGLDISNATFKLTTNGKSGGVQHFTITSATVEGQKATIVMDYRHDPATENNDISFKALHTDIREETDSVLVMDIDGIKVDTSKIPGYEAGDEIPMLTVRGTVSGDFYSLSTLRSVTIPFTFDWASSQAHDLDYTAESAPYASSISVDKGEGLDYIIENQVGAGAGVSNDKVWLTVAIEQVDVEVIKVWDDEDDQDGIRPEKITINLMADGEEYDSIELDATNALDANTWSAVFENLPKHTVDADKKLVPIVYSIGEIEVEGYETEIDDPEIDADGNYTFNVTNSHEPEQVVIVGLKIWDDKDNQDGIQPDSITINLLADGDKVDSVEVTETDNWAFMFTGYDRYKDNGTAIVYTIEEDEVTDYIADIATLDPEMVNYDKDDGSIVSIYTYGFEITNTHNPEKTSVNGTKTWDDKDDQDGKRPASITVNLLADGEKIDNVTVTAEDEWKYEFTDLDKYADGVAIVYTVTEDEVKEYTTKINGYDITNTHTPEKTTVRGSKTWVDNDDQDGKRPASITVNLLGNGTKVASKTVTAEDGWKFEFTNLDKYSKGKEIKYTVTENEVTDYTTDIDGTTITNTHEPELTDISVVKVWNASADTELPGSITVTLMDNGTAIDSAVLTEASGWQYTFEGLTKYRAGELIPYTIVEDKVEGFTTVVNGDAENGFVVINTPEFKPEPIDVPVKKVWKDENNEEGIRPTTVTVRLYNEDGLVGTTTLSADDGWQYTFTNVPKTNMSGREYHYYVRETAVRNYVTTYSKVDGVLVVTNTALVNFDDDIVPLAAGIIMNEGDCFN